MFSDTYYTYTWDQVSEKIYSTSKNTFLQAINNPLSEESLYALLSPVADNYLEELAVTAQKVTKQRFGNTIQLYTPLYISNECTNACVYCGFNSKNNIKRTTLSLNQVLEEAHIIYNMGFRHLLLLSGEDKNAVSVNTLKEITGKLHKQFASISIEVYPMDVHEYRSLADAGIDGLTIYQETYNSACYQHVHPAGKKRDFSWRLNTPDRGGQAGLRRIGIGALLGLSDWRVEGFFTALHALYLSRKYWKSHINVSFPRLTEHCGFYKPEYNVTDRDLAHLICIFRLVLPDSGLVLSTRESRKLRDNLFPLGITMMSAGSKTEPGGYAELHVADQQFAVHDTRTPDEIVYMLKQKGYDPVWKDWDRDFLYK